MTVHFAEWIYFQIWNQCFRSYSFVRIFQSLLKMLTSQFQESDCGPKKSVCLIQTCFTVSVNIPTEHRSNIHWLLSESLLVIQILTLFPAQCFPSPTNLVALDVGGSKYIQSNSFQKFQAKPISGFFWRWKRETEKNIQSRLNSISPCFEHDIHQSEYFEHIPCCGPELQV